MSSAPPTIEQLVNDCQGLVRSLARKAYNELPHNLVDLDDLIGYGQVGLSEAANAYDASRGVKFSTFAYYRIRGAIYDGLTLMAWFRKSPFARVKYEQVANELLNTEVEDEDDPDNLRTSADWFSRMTGMLAIAYLATGDDENESTAANNIVDQSAESPQQLVGDEEVREKVKGLIDALPGQEGTLMRAAYYEGLSLKEAGKRIGVSKAWASRIHARTLKRLANTLRDMGIVEK